MPELEAPSPTFTLVQVYEGRECPLVHADFYRLKGPEDLREIGFAETVQGAVTLVEWGERAAAALPAERLDITLEFDPERGPDSRLAYVPPARVDDDGAVQGGARRRGADGAGRLDRRARTLMYGDASTRAYERLTDPSGRTAILMIAPPRPPGAAAAFRQNLCGNRQALAATFAPISRSARACARSAIRRRASTPTASPTGWR